MRRTRQVLAVMLVTTALCADRGAAALSVGTSQARACKTQSDASSASLAGRFFARLSRTLGHQVTVVLPRQIARVGWTVATGCSIRDDQSPPTHTPISPFQFRLP